MKSTEIYGLYLEDDDSTSFHDWREKMNGVTDSNMTKIDAVLGNKVDDTELDSHNTSTESHSDIRDLITTLSTKVNNFLDVDDSTSDQLSEVLELIENNKGTLESLTSNKVNISDIIDNLTTTDTTKVLSANQGVALKSLIDTLQTAVDGKAASSHNHNISDITGAVRKVATYVTASNTTFDLDTATDSIYILASSRSKGCPIGGSWLFIRQLFYSSDTASSNRIQIAYPYGAADGSIPSNSIAIRAYHNGVWGAWKQFATTDYAVNKAGDTMTDNLIVAKDLIPTVEVYSTAQGKGSFHKNANLTADYGTQVSDNDVNGNTAILQLRASQWDYPSTALSFHLRNADRTVSNTYQVLHTGNKDLITPADIGAVSKAGDTFEGDVDVEGTLTADDIYVMNGIQIEGESYLGGDVNVDGVIRSEYGEFSSIAMRSWADGRGASFGAYYEDDDDVPIMAFYGTEGDEYVRLRRIENPVEGFDAANKDYVDNNIPSSGYGVCGTAAATAAKTVTVSGNFSLVTGARVTIKFTYTNTASNPTLNVNGTGAKPIYQYGTTAASNSSAVNGWAAGAIQTFTYDGTGWVRDYWYNTTYYPGWVTCTTGATTAAKVGSTSRFQLTPGHFSLMLYYTNTYAGALTLNINSTGAKPIYINGIISSSTNYTLPYGLYTVYYDGSRYFFRTDGAFDTGAIYCGVIHCRGLITQDAITVDSVEAHNSITAPDYYKAAGELLTQTFTVTVPAGSWTHQSELGYYYKTIAVSGILATDNPVVDFVAHETDYASNLVYADCMSKVLWITTQADAITIRASEAISTAFPIQLKVVR